MAEEFHPSNEISEASTAPRKGRLIRRTPAKTPAVRSATGKTHPVRSFVTLAAVAGMVATVAIPAFAAADRGDVAEAVTLQQVSADDAQSLVVASEGTPETLERGGYSATTPEEIQEKKEKEAAAKAAKAALAARLAAASAASSSSGDGQSSSYSSSVPLVAPGSGTVRRPLARFDNFGRPYAGHKGTDYMVGRGEPIYSVADGTVVASSESGPGWGVYVKISHNVGGTNVTSLYAHMDWGTRRVSVGDRVSAGQLIGQVGDTGRANGTHLHLEIRVNNGYTNAESWLQANAG
ncbi:M23 family metallopeptidase [Microbacterium sp. EYE_5]|uniref:M23 family metallopeptidase n=1 Tax=unclassified Microbacterium TaxID=2609290 RepID=UPI0020062E87|nr:MULTISPECIES: M23 family metallopeptidase [unclassified Microbacterium]MCK6081338.1 M23 family metallopeptidase [Microbacterium sp. EYE_382]MCK6086608.1 M23 family metallopeptidase [Microbacterium sp. EYE_384]MCK6123894.1 M23 family metallopeptidase [Microbacterium sp. EYE_80]MCK6126803.1 M23 family metallopeptidase [Microbacterium sp. EYE_79]MCK6142293.1 M23 family metallopeptidase [Microbacterium sp. EYE_39]